MGFLSNLFDFVKDNSDEENEDLENMEDDEEEDEGASSVLGHLYKGMPLDVITSDNQLSLSGKLTSREEGMLTLERLPGWLAFEVIPVGEPVSVRGYTSRMEQFNLTATIQESSRVLCKLKDVQVAPVDNQRLSFRIPINTTAWLYRREDERCQRAEECTLIDVSTGGCCIESEYVHEENEILRIKIKLDDYQPMHFLGQIIRANAYGKRYRYGILFAQLREDELTSLTRTLYNIQVGNRRAWNQSKEGPWH